MEISKEQVLDLYQHSGVTVQNHLNKWFPEAFKVKLEVGKVYKFIGSNKSIIKILNLKDNSKCYGFTSNGDYFTQGTEAKCMSYRYADRSDTNEYVEATTEEWESALIEEAKRRDLYDAVHFKHANILLPNSGDADYNKTISEDQIWTQYGCVFYKGVWAEIIKTFSKEEAEKLLGGKII